MPTYLVTIWTSYFNIGMEIWKYPFAVEIGVHKVADFGEGNSIRYTVADSLVPWGPNHQGMIIYISFDIFDVKVNLWLLL
jgi:hypothetical protein